MARGLSRTRRTSCRCPMRYARSIACMSCDGFQLGSKMTTRVAATRLMPIPPAFVESMKRNLLGSVLNWSTRFVRSAAEVEPSRRSLVMPLRSTKSARMSSICVEYEKRSTCEQKV